MNICLTALCSVTMWRATPGEQRGIPPDVQICLSYMGSYEASAHCRRQNECVYEFGYAIFTGSPGWPWDPSPPMFPGGPLGPDGPGGPGGPGGPAWPWSPYTQIKRETEKWWKTHQNCSITAPFVSHLFLDGTWQFFHTHKQFMFNIHFTIQYITKQRHLAAMTRQQKLAGLKGTWRDEMAQFSKASLRNRGCWWTALSSKEREFKAVVSYKTVPFQHIMLSKWENTILVHFISCGLSGMLFCCNVCKQPFNHAKVHISPPLSFVLSNSKQACLLAVQTSIGANCGVKAKDTHAICQ